MLKNKHIHTYIHRDRQVYISHVYDTTTTATTIIAFNNNQIIKNKNNINFT